MKYRGQEAPKGCGYPDTNKIFDDIFNYGGVEKYGKNSRC